MENGSFSFKKLRWFDETVDGGDFCQKLFFSVGDGCSTTSECLRVHQSLGFTGR